MRRLRCWGLTRPGGVGGGCASEGRGAERHRRRQRRKSCKGIPDLYFNVEIRNRELAKFVRVVVVNVEIANWHFNVEITINEEAKL